MSAGGSPKLGLPILAIDRVLGVGRETSDRTKRESSAIWGDGGGGANCGGCEAMGGSGATGGIAPGSGGRLAGAGTEGGAATGAGAAAGNGARATVGDVRSDGEALPDDPAESDGGTGEACAAARPVADWGAGAVPDSDWRRITSSLYLAFARSAASDFAIRSRSSSVGPWGLSGTLARFGKALSLPGAGVARDPDFVALPLSPAEADSSLSEPTTASRAPRYHSTGFAQSGVLEQPERARSAVPTQSARRETPAAAEPRL